MEAHEMEAKAEQAARFLKSMANANRLRVMCRLLEGEETAGDLSLVVGISQANLSQHLSWLKQENLVQTRREGTTIFYSLSGNKVMPLMGALYEMFCKTDDVSL